MTSWYRWYPFFLWSSSWRKTWTSWNHHYWHSCWFGRECFLLFWSYVQQQWESICTSSKPNHWAKLGSPRYSAQMGFSAVEKSDPWHPCCGSMRDAGCFTYLELYAKRPFPGDLQHPDQSDIQGCHGASTCWMLELCIPKPVKAIRKHEYHGKHGKTMGNR